MIFKDRSVARKSYQYPCLPTEEWPFENSLIPIEDSDVVPVFEQFLLGRFCKHPLGGTVGLYPTRIVARVGTILSSFNHFDLVHVIVFFEVLG